MDNQITERSATDTIKIMRGVGWAAVHVVIMLWILAFGGKLNLDSFTLSIALLIAWSILVYSDTYQRRRFSRPNAGNLDDKGSARQTGLWRSARGQVAAAIIMVFAAAILIARPFDGDTNFEIFKISLIGCLVVIGLSDIPTRYREHGRYGPLVWSVLGTAFYAFAIICVFERETFVHLPLILQTNLPTFLEFPYVTLVFFMAGAGATIASRTWEARLRR